MAHHSMPARIADAVPGTLAAGTWLPGYGAVARSSLTAYEVDGYGWVPFTAVHRHQAATPLVVLR